MSQIKNFVSIVGLHKAFKTYNGTSGSIEGYLPNLLDTLPVDANGNTFNENSILFLIADATDEGRYVFTGVKAVEDGTKYTYGGDSARSYLHQRDTFIWALGALIAGSDCGFESFSPGLGDTWINTEVTTSDSGDVTINVTHKLTTLGIAGKHESGTLDPETSGATVPVITSITVDSTGHVKEVTTGKATDTTYKLQLYSELNRLGVSTTFRDLIQLVPIIGGKELTALSPITIDEVKHLRYEGSSGERLTVEVTNAPSSSSKLIMTAAAVQAAITELLELGVSFKGVASLSYVLMEVSSCSKGEMWKLNSIDVEFNLYKSRIYPELTSDSTPLKIGDVLVAKDKISNGTPKWYVIPSGDDIEDSWRAVLINGEDFLTNLIARPPSDSNANDGMAINLKNGNMISITVDSGRANGNITFSHNLPWSVKPSTTAEAGKYISGITIDNYGHITGISTASISESIKDNIKQVDFAVGTEQSDESPVEIGINSTKNDQTTVKGTSMYMEGSDGVGVKTDSSGHVIVQGTSYTLGTTATTTDKEDGTEVSITMSSSGHATTSLSAKFELASDDPTIDISSSSGTVNIDYTGAASDNDWAELEVDLIAKKFGKIVGIHKIFNSAASIEDSIFDGDVVSSELNENSIIYFIADLTDASKTEFSSLRFKVGWGYVWAKGKMYNADLINLSQLYDDLIKTVLPTDAVFPSGFLKNKNWQELPEECYKNVFTLSGTYIVQIKYKQAIYSGIIPYTEVAFLENRDAFTDELLSVIEVNTSDEIPLTLCGYSSEGERLYLKIANGTRNVTTLSKPSLFIASSTGNGLIPSLFELKFKKLL